MDYVHQCSSLVCVLHLQNPKKLDPETALCYYIATHCCYYNANPFCNTQPYVKCMVCYFTIKEGES